MNQLLFLFVGGLSSYGVLLLLLSFLKSDPLALLIDPSDSWSSVPHSKILTQFLLYFGRLFDQNCLMTNENTQIVIKRTQYYQ